MTPQEALRDLADTIDFIENKYGATCTVIRGQAVWGREDTYFKNIDIDLFWDDVTEDSYGFIGIMPNQWRPEVHLRAKIGNVLVPLYSFVPGGFNHFDGGFISEYPRMMEKLKNAPEFIKAKLGQLYADCCQSRKEEDLLRELKEVEAKRDELKGELENYSEKG